MALPSRASWFWSLAGLLVAAAITWWAGPLVVVMDHRPLDSVAERLTLLMGLPLAVLLAYGWERWRATRARVQLMRDAGTTGDVSARELSHRFRLALKQIGTRAAGQRRDGIPHVPLHERPWYLILGPSGSGKSALLKTSGLTAATSSPTQPSAPTPVAGSGSSRAMDWWFTDEAVLFETTRHLTALSQTPPRAAAPTEDDSADTASMAAVDDAALQGGTWTHFLKLLRRARPRRPLNGIILTLDIQHLLRAAPQEQQATARRMAGWLHDIEQRLAMELPVWLVLTHLDRLEGFNETFAAMTPAERGQCLGVTLPLPDRLHLRNARKAGRWWRTRSAGSAPPAGSPPEGSMASTTAAAAEEAEAGHYRDTASPVRQGLLGLVQRLQAHRMRLLDGEDTAAADPVAASQVAAARLAFPMTVLAMAEPLARFVDVLTAPMEDGHCALLRGLYLTCAVQPGTRVPTLDPISQALRQRLPLHPSTASLAQSSIPSWEAAAQGPGSASKVTPEAASAAFPSTSAVTPTSKVYFTHQLWRDVVLAESWLVTQTPEAAARRRRRRAIHWAGLLTLFGLALGYSTVSYLHAEERIRITSSRLPTLKAAVAALGADGQPGTAGSADDGSVPALLPLLDALSAIAHPPDGGWSQRLNLFDESQLADGGETAYERLLAEALLPRIQRRLAQRLADSVAAAELERRGTPPARRRESVHVALRGYLMGYQHARFKPMEWRRWVLADPAPGVSPELLTQHLDPLVALSPLPSRLPLDTSLVRRARALLTARTLEERALSQLGAAATASGARGQSVISLAGDQAADVFVRASGRPLTAEIPALFTRDGFQRAVMPQLQAIASKLVDEEAWLTHDSAPPGTPSAASLLRSVAERYAQAYADAWEEDISDLRLQPAMPLKRAAAISRRLAAPDSPLAAYLHAVARQGRLERGARATAPGISGAIASGASALTAQAMAAIASGAVAEATPASGPLAGTQLAQGATANARIVLEVQRRLAPWTSLEQGRPSGVEQAMQLFTAVSLHFNAVETALAEQSVPPAPEALEGVRQAALRQPEPVRSMLTTLVQAARADHQRLTQQQLRTALQPLAQRCSRMIGGRFPMGPLSAPDVLPRDFSQWLGPGGELDTFFQQHLAPMVDTTRKPWRFKDAAQESGQAAAGRSGRAARPSDRPSAAATHALAQFERAALIRDTFFSGPGAPPGLKGSLFVTDFTGGLSEMTMDLDTQRLHWTKDAATALPISAPAAANAPPLRLTTPGIAPRTLAGPWALLRLLRQQGAAPGQRPEELRFSMELADGKRAAFLLTADSTQNGWKLPALEQFKCPASW